MATNSILLIKNHFLLFILIINAIFLCYNIIVIKKGRINNQTIIFKDTDSFSFNIARKSFKQYSSYFNKKYEKKNIINIFLKLLKEKIKLFFGIKKTIRIYLVGSSNDYYKNIIRSEIIEGLQNKYNFVFTHDNPDYLIFDVFDCKYINSKFDNTIKIAFYTENIIPDFNKADYAIGFDNINYLDRYFRKTTLIWIFERKYSNIKNKDFIMSRYSSYKSTIKKKFCGAVISNGKSTNGFRIKFIIVINNQYAII